MDTPNSSPNTNPTPAERPVVTPNIIMPGVAAETVSAPAPAESAPASGPGLIMPAGTIIVPAPPAPATAAPVGAPAMPNPVQGAPAAAGDVDVIEPEWVEKAEGVIAAHVNDPYGEEQAVEKLQEEYLQQRYGIKVADPNLGDVKPNGS